MITDTIPSTRQSAGRAREGEAESWLPRLQASVHAQQRAFRGEVIYDGPAHTHRVVALFHGCPSGTKGTHTCTNCDPGEFSKRGAAHVPPTRDMLPLICRPCPPGQYQDRAGQDACIECPAGKYADGIDLAFTCTSCPLGTVQGEPGGSGCRGCEAGKYADAASTSCLRCAAMTFSTANATHCQLCPSATEQEVTRDERGGSGSEGRRDEGGGEAGEGGGAAEVPVACQQPVVLDTAGSTRDAAGGEQEAEGRETDKEEEEVQKGMPLGYLLGLGMLGLLSLGAGAGLCGCGCFDASCCQRSRSNIIRRLLPSAQKEDEPPTRSRWKLDKLEAISEGTDEVLLRTVALHDDLLVRVDEDDHHAHGLEQRKAQPQQENASAAKLRSPVILSASFSLQGDACLPDTRFEKVQENRLLRHEPTGTCVPREAGLADLVDTADTEPGGQTLRVPPHLAGYIMSDLGLNPSVDGEIAGSGDAFRREGSGQGSGASVAGQRDGRRVSFQDQLPTTMHGAQEQVRY